MEKYAVIKIKDKQYKVAEGDEILVPGEYKEDVDKPDTLLLVNKGKILVGEPVIKGDFVKLKVVEEKVKGKKLTMMKFRAKSRYRKKIGFRSLSTKLRVEKIT